MIRVDQFNKYAREFADWITQYYKEIEKYPVKSQVKPGDIFDLLPSEAPQKGESIDHIFDDFKSKLLPGITHWQSPNFFAYFPADSSFPSILAEMLTAALGVQGMKWDTSPAATELEEKVINWLKKMTGIPAEMEGCIQDTASTSTLAAILTAREKATGFKINEQGMSGMPQLRVYASAHGHSSIDKAVKIAGLGIKNLVKIPVDSEFRMIPAELEKAIQQDKAK
ncbi:MAG: pyridoxal phosphate-dependent decarboxylase family protein, partial [Bacteroidota bacterium]